MRTFDDIEVRRPALAEEVVEDTYFQVWRQGVRFEDRNRFFASCWLMVEPPATIRPFFRFFS